MQLPTAFIFLAYVICLSSLESFVELHLPFNLQSDSVLPSRAFLLAPDDCCMPCAQDSIRNLFAQLSDIWQCDAGARCAQAASGIFDYQPACFISGCTGGVPEKCRGSACETTDFMSLPLPLPQPQPLRAHGQCQVSPAVECMLCC